MMRMGHFFTHGLLGMVLAMGLPLAAQATPKHCPPGHAKKGWCTPGQRYVLPKQTKWRRVDEWQRYHLPPPRDGAVYGVIDGEVYLILEATREVLEAVGAVNAVLK